MSTTQGEGKPAQPATIEIKEVDQALHIAPTIYIDGAHGMIASEQVVKFNLYQDRLVMGGGTDPKVPIERVVCARLVMSPVVFLQLTEWLSKNAKSMFPQAQS